MAVCVKILSPTVCGPCWMCAQAVLDCIGFWMLIYVNLVRVSLRYLSLCITVDANCCIYGWLSVVATDLSLL